MHCHQKSRDLPTTMKFSKNAEYYGGLSQASGFRRWVFSESSRHLDQDTNETRFILSVNCGVKASLLLPCTPHEPKSCKTFWVRFHSFGMSGGNPPN